MENARAFPYVRSGECPPLLDISTPVGHTYVHVHYCTVGTVRTPTYFYVLTSTYTHAHTSLTFLHIYQLREQTKAWATRNQNGKPICLTRKSSWCISGIRNSSEFYFEIQVWPGVKRILFSSVSLSFLWAWTKRWLLWLNFHCWIDCFLFLCFLFSLQPKPRTVRNRNEKFDKNITKRGNVSIGKAADHQDDFPVSKTLIAFFLIVVIGSSLVQVFNLFSTAAPPPLE